MIKNIKHFVWSREMVFQIIDWFLLSTIVFYANNHVWRPIVIVSLVLVIGCFFLANTIRRRKHFPQYPKDLPKKAESSFTTLAIELALFPEIAYRRLLFVLSNQQNYSIKFLFIQLGTICGMLILTGLYWNFKINKALKEMI